MFKYLLFSFLAIMATNFANAAEDHAWGYCLQGVAWKTNASIKRTRACDLKMKLRQQPKYGWQRRSWQPPKFPLWECISGVRKPEADWVCQLPVATEAGVTVLANTQRCTNAYKRECQTGDGGGSGPGAHNVPKGAWFRAAGAGHVPEVRCECGCLEGSVLVGSPSGFHPISDFARVARTHKVRLFTTNAMTYSRQETPDLIATNFTVGPEDDLVVTLATETRSITVTTNHPVLTLDGRDQKMRRAEDVGIGDFLVLETGETAEVLARHEHFLDSQTPLVYNVDTLASQMADRLIAANGILVGDLTWQKKLSEQHSRTQNFLSAARHR